MIRNIKTLLNKKMIVINQKTYQQKNTSIKLNSTYNYSPKIWLIEISINI